MRTLLKSLLVGVLGVVLAAPAAFAQNRVEFTQPQLEQMLAPIALYPDALLSQVLMAATYPVEVVQAARWTRANPDLKGEDAVWAVERMDWDPSVKSLVAFPHVLQRMDEKLDWTEDLGEAFIAQEQDVMDTIQLLRRRADAAGNLDAIEELRVMRQGAHILIEPAGTRIVYVPYYDPLVVYGPWWRPAHPPVRWVPWPGYYVSGGYASGFWWGSGIAIRIGFFFGHFDWPHRQVIVVHRHPARVIVNRQPTIIYREPDARPVRWRHERHHRRGAAYKHIVVPRPQPPHSVIPGEGRRLPAPTHAAPPPQVRSEPRPPAAVRPAPRAEPRPSNSVVHPVERRDAARHVAPAPAPAPRSAPERREPAKASPRARETAPEARPAVPRDHPGPRSDARPANHQRNADDRQTRVPAPAREQPAAAERRAVRGDDHPRRNGSPQEDRPRRRAMGGEG